MLEKKYSITKNEIIKKIIDDVIEYWIVLSILCVFSFIIGMYSRLCIEYYIIFLLMGIAHASANALMKIALIDFINHNVSFINIILILTSICEFISEIIMGILIIFRLIGKPII